MESAIYVRIFKSRTSDITESMTTDFQTIKSMFSAPDWLENSFSVNVHCLNFRKWTLAKMELNRQALVDKMATAMAVWLRLVMR